MAESNVHTATKLTDEPWFVRGRQVLTRDGTQIGSVLQIDTVRLERRTSTDPEAWEVAFDEDAFGSLQVLDDSHGGTTYADSMVGGILAADPDDDPPAGPDEYYMLLAVCTVELTAAYGSREIPVVFRRRWRIPASALTDPAS